MLPADLHPFREPLTSCLSPILPLAQKFHSCEEIDTSKVDFFSNKSFKELIQERRESELPYFVAVTIDVTHNIEVFDAADFVIHFFKHNNEISPQTKQPFEDVAIYQLDLVANQFNQYCTLSSLHKNEHSCLSKILISNPLQLAEHKGNFYHTLGAIEENEGNYEAARMWYDKSKAQNCSRGYVSLSNWFHEGIHFPQSTSFAIKELQGAIRCASPQTKRHCEEALQELKQQQSWEADATHRGIAFPINNDSDDESMEDTVYGSPPKSAG